MIADIDRAKLYKIIWIDLAGTVIGAGVGYFAGGLIVDRILAHEKQMRISAWATEVSDQILEHEKKMRTSIEEVAKKPVEEIAKTVDTIASPAKPLGRPKKNKALATTEAKEVGIVDYTKFAKTDAPEKPGIAEVVQERIGTAGPVEDVSAAITNMANILTNQPHRISLDEFVAAKGWEHMVLNYYETDDTLADESNNIIKNRDEILGQDALKQFGIGSEDPDVVYIRNNSVGVDYEVIRILSSYGEYVLGVPAEKKPRGKAKKVEQGANGKE